MGCGNSSLTDEQIEEYEECTFFTRKEILRLHGRFMELQKQWHEDNPNEAVPEKLPCDLICSLPELETNPFRRRVCAVFSEMGDGDLAFEDFLNMASIFSESAKREFKVFYLFRIYDFDNDGFLDGQDLATVVQLLTDDGLTDEQRDDVVQRLLDEGDIDSNGFLSFDEFNKILSRLPDFATKFRMSF